MRKDFGFMPYFKPQPAFKDADYHENEKPNEINSWKSEEILAMNNAPA